MDAIPSSPSKFNARHQRTSATPSLSATEDAQRLLKAYAHTNSAGSLLRALPSYGCADIPGLAQSLPQASFIDDDGDSEITKASRRVRDAKNCWEMLREGFVMRQDQSAESSTSRSRYLRGSHRDDTSDREGSPSDVPAPVGPHAWPVLDWLLMLFEKDEATSDASAGPRKSDTFPRSTSTCSLTILQHAIRRCCYHKFPLAEQDQVRDGTSKLRLTSRSMRCTNLAGHCMRPACCPSYAISSLTLPFFALTPTFRPFRMLL